VPRKRDDVLKGLDEIDWGKLQCGSGPAHDVPIYIEQLAEGEDVLSDLFGDICHQGSVSEATSYAVPFLWRILARPGSSPQIAGLLSAIAEGASFEAVGDTGRAYRAVWDGRATAFDMLASGDESRRRGAVSILACFRQKRDEILPAFHQLFLREDLTAHEKSLLGVAAAALGEFVTNAFEPGTSVFSKEARELAIRVASGDEEGRLAGLCMLSESIEQDAEDLSNWQW
jgi:hypothetical protein